MNKKILHILDYILMIALGIFAGIITFYFLNKNGLVCISNPFQYIADKYHVLISCVKIPNFENNICNIVNNLTN